MGGESAPARDGGARWLNITEAAAYLGVSTKTIRRWIHAGAIQAELRPGRTRPQYVVPVAGLDARRPDRRPAQADLVDLIQQQFVRWDEALAVHLAAGEQRLTRVEDELRRLTAAVQARSDGAGRQEVSLPHAGGPCREDAAVVAELRAGLGALRLRLAGSAAQADLLREAERLAALAARLDADRVPGA